MTSEDSSIPFFIFDDGLVEKVSLETTAQYAEAMPFPHMIFDNFLPKDIAEKLLSVFPTPDSPVWIDRKISEQKLKLGIGSAKNLKNISLFIHNILFAFNSSPLIEFLETLTNIKGLIPDPHLRGGGLHQILSGGNLNVHADYNYHNQLQLYRRVNILLYLNKDWKTEYGGHLELWDKDMSGPVVSIAPIFNRCVIFNTTSISYHGHPQTLSCPESMTRKSIALYYYARDSGPGQIEQHDTLWQTHPN